MSAARFVRDLLILSQQVTYAYLKHLWAAGFQSEAMQKMGALSATLEDMTAELKEREKVHGPALPCPALRSLSRCERAMLGTCVGRLV